MIENLRNGNLIISTATNQTKYITHKILKHLQTAFLNLLNPFKEGDEMHVSEIF
jgi:hypothetical protein